ncbi:bifunctional RNase H/acid phosphatase [Mycolicibacterium gadium]|uniref:Bifunctional RNase H/acid phosphatase n=1 Tax=Mycolicibacterium gadium TaxID=1794 RepID=A0ABT6GL35_MYCGU|nr:bifunctional RNase H/acid phosphatase [Mycolicibacterium gadium]MDG5482022.1 bifunctional RNase H/acid phosphatase [Mycolicibacterium gadium]
MKVVVEADGGSRGNPGPAGYGAVVWTADHNTVLAERKQAIGRATNNVAEYSGLIAGLEEAADLGASEVDVNMDSKLVVEQMSGRWKVKHPDMVPLYQQATALSARFDRVTYIWVPRAKNSHADRLANEAMDAAAELETSTAEPKTEQVTNPAGWTGARGAPTRFLLLRHGQTELSLERRYSGRGNPALTDLGRRQADAAAQFLGNRGGISAVITSPLQRAHDTADAAAKALGLDVSVDADLIETDFGGWEGLTFGEAAERDPALHKRWLRDTSVAPPDGESFDAAAERVGRARARIISEHPGETVLVVSHVTPIKTLLRIALDAGPSVLYRMHLDLASLSIAEFYPDGAASVRLVNQTAYLG